MTKTLFKILLCSIGILIASSANAIDVGRIDDIDVLKRTITVDDRVYVYTPYLVIQRWEADSGERLPTSYLSVGQWVSISKELTEIRGMKRITRIKLFRNKAHADEVIQEKFAD